MSVISKPSCFHVIAIVLLMLTAQAGCGRPLPDPLESPVFTIKGTPGQEVYVSVDTHFFKKSGGSSSHRTGGGYGVKVLDKDGSLEIDAADAEETPQGMEVTIANLVEEKVTLTLTLNGAKIEEKRSMRREKLPRFR